MWMIIKGICLVFVLFLIPFLWGTLMTGFWKEQKESVIKNWVVGFILGMALAELLIVPATFLELSFHKVKIVYYGISMVAAIVAGWKNRKRIFTMLQTGIKKIPQTHLVIWILLLVMGVQIFVYGFYMHEDSDDAFFVATTVTTLEEDTLFQINPYTGKNYKELPSRYVLSPFPVFHALLADVTDLHPAIVTHTVLPGIYLLFSYGIYWLIGKKLFGDSSEKTGWLMLFTAVYLTYAGYSTSTPGSMMLLRIWQGKALLSSALLPMIFYMFLGFLKKKDDFMQYIFMICVMLACCLVSSMGIITGAVLFGCCGIVAAIMEKNIVLLGKMACCAIPNLVLAVIYLFIR